MIAWSCAAGAAEPAAHVGALGRRVVEPAVRAAAAARVVGALRASTMGRRGIERAQPRSSSAATSAPARSVLVRTAGRRPRPGARASSCRSSVGEAVDRIDHRDHAVEPIGLDEHRDGP